MSNIERATKTSRGESAAVNRRSDLLSAVIERAPDAIWVFEMRNAHADRSALVYANPAYHELFGNSGTFDAGYIASDVQRGTPFRRLTSLHRPSADSVWLDVSYQPRVEEARTLWFAVARDVTETILAQRRSAHLARALDEAHEAIAVCVAHEGHWCFDYVNRAFTAMLGYELEDIAKQTWRDLVASRANNKHVEDMRMGLLTGQTVRMELAFRRKSGSSALVMFSATPFAGEDPDSMWAVATLRDVTMARQEERRLREQALNDPLTGLHNRREFERLLRDAVDMTKSDGGAHVVLFMDLDGFKRINDTEGHDAGDRVLIAVAKTLKRTLLPSDEAARWGGDEFAAILYFCAPEKAIMRARGIIDALTSSPECRGVGASIGIVRVRSGSNVHDLMIRADRLVYEAKAGGRNSVVGEPP